jgi:hypothetical protein
MESVISNCSKLLTKIGSTKYAIEENFPDLARLCERAEIFQRMIDDAAANPQERFEEGVENLINELARAFKSILNFINDSTDREQYFGITEFSYRVSFITDLTKWTLNMTKIAESLNLSFDTDSEKRRREDFEVIVLTIFPLSLLTLFILLGREASFLERCLPGARRGLHAGTLREDRKALQQLVERYLELRGDYSKDSLRIQALHPHGRGVAGAEGGHQATERDGLGPQRRDPAGDPEECANRLQHHGGS